AFLFSCFVVNLVGREECGEITDSEMRLLRLLTPLVKLTTAKQAVAVASEALEAFGGAGYVEDTGLPTLLRDAQVLPIWEGTTNVLSLDLLRAEQRDEALAALLDDSDRLLATVPPDGDLARAAAAPAVGRDGVGAAVAGLATADEDAREAAMRALSLRLGRVYSAALLCAHAAARRAAGHDAARASAAALRFADLRLADAWRPPDARALSQTAVLLARDT